MSRASSLSLVGASRLNVVERDEAASPCSCGCIAASPPRRRPVTGGVLTLLGVVGWLCVPKCPLCLATYIAIGSGVTVSFALSQTLRQLWIGLAVALVLAGVWRLAQYAQRQRRTRGAIAR